MAIYQKSVFIFRRDLRLDDNTGLLQALQESESVVPVFIFDPAQTDRTKNEYFSESAFAFLLHSLSELDSSLRKLNSQLYILSGSQDEIVRNLIEKDHCDGVFVNKDYTPYARLRDKSIADVCEESEIEFMRYDDITLSPIEEIRTGQDKLYSVFTPFMRKAAAYKVPEPTKNTYTNYYQKPLQTPVVSLSDYSADTTQMQPLLTGGRKEALSILKQAKTFIPNYTNTRNLPALENGTSRLSAHHKFGTISIRETYQKAATVGGTHSQFVAELYWRDFYYYIAYHFPIIFKQSFLPWAKHLKWKNNNKHFSAWCEGKTGVPIVDAAMRELNTTGWMHNRSRMIVASYLTKSLLIDWRWGERYFASKLIDYDPSQNNGGWQWSASVGADPRPLRIFNPYTQAKNYDPDAKYIKRWVPELVDVPAELLTDGKTQDFGLLAPDYPAPLIDQKESYHRAQATYKAAKQAWKDNQ